MKLLLFTWKDLKNPMAGGAEVVNEELARRLVKDGHEVTLLVGGFEGGAPEERRDGYKIIRVGGRVSVYWAAFRYYKKHLQGWADLVIEEVNTVPFFTRLYVKEPSMLFFHQLARRIWFHEIFMPLSLIGYAAEPFYIRFLRRTGRAITVSESTKQDLRRYGFKEDEISLISEGINSPAIPRLGNVKKYDKPTVLSFGAIRPMKQTLHQVKAFEIAKQSIPGLTLKVAGNPEGKYGQKVWRAVMSSPYTDDIEFLGPVSSELRNELMQRSHLFLASSVKEGWGLTVTEAASQGTPAVVYDVSGLRDSVRDGETGIITRPNPKALAEGIVTALADKKAYGRMRKAGWQWSQEITFEQCYKDFKTVLEASS